MHLVEVRYASVPYGMIYLSRALTPPKGCP